MIGIIKMLSLIFETLKKLSYYDKNNNDTKQILLDSCVTWILKKLVVKIPN